MTETAFTITQQPNPFAATGAALTMNAVDTVNGNSLVSTGTEMLVIQNTDGAGAHTFTVTSQADPQGRTGDWSMSVPLSSFVITQRFPQTGWAVGGLIKTPSSNNTNFKVGVIRTV